MTTLDEAKGTVDKTSGHGKKDPASPFSVGQRVAQYKGMGKTIHGNVVTPHAVSGGTKGSMVKFSHGTEFVPHKDLKDAGQYWKDEQDAMYKKRGVKEEIDLEEGIAHTYHTSKNDDGSYSWKVSRTEYNKPTVVIHSGKEKTRAKAMAVAKKHLVATRKLASDVSGARNSMYEHVELEEGILKNITRILTNKDAKSRAAQEIAKAQAASMVGDTKTSKKHFNRFDKFDRLATKSTNEDIELEEGSSGTIIHKVHHEGKVKFITRYAKAAEAVAKKIEANTGKACKITQHISDKNGFYRLHKEDVDISETFKYDVDHMPGRRLSMSDINKTSKFTVATNAVNGHQEKRVDVEATSKNHALNLAGEHFRKNGMIPRTHFDGLRIVEDIDDHDPWEAEEREEKRRKLAAAMASINHLSKTMDHPTGSNYPAWLKRKQDAAKKVRETQGK